MYIDGHLDIAYNALTVGRDVTKSVLATRAAEGGTNEFMGSCTVGLPELVRGGVGLLFGTLFTLPAAALNSNLPSAQSYNTPAEANALALEQLAVYHELAARGALRPIYTRADLDAHCAAWQAGDRTVGLVLLMENADPIREPAEAAWWHAQGVRIIGPAWQATRYCGGTHQPGPLTASGRALLGEMARVGLALDVSHMAEESFWQALDCFDGTLLASHSNCRVLAPARNADRHLGDEMIRALLRRDAIIGTVLYNGFLSATYQRGGPKESVGLDSVVLHIDHVCQLAGDARHAAIGSDLDGGLGREHIPRELDSIADLPRIAEALSDAGYSDADVAAIMGGNWLRMLENIL